MNAGAHSSTDRLLRLFAPAKINWLLTIERKRPDGYHDIHTVFQAITLGDELECRATAEEACAIECDDPAVPTGPENLVARAWARLRQAHPGRVGGLAVRLAKRIPAGAGLGGGSSDAAAALIAVNTLYGLGLTPGELEAHAAELGSDCPFFIRGGAALAAGRGERLTPLRPALPPIWLVLVHPGFPSPTAAAYARVTPAHWENGRAAAAVATALERGDVTALRAASRNIFSEILLAEDGRYRRLAAAMEQQGLLHPLLSGSGSVIYAHATSPAQARAAAQTLAGEYPLAEAVQPLERGAGEITS